MAPRLEVRIQGADFDAGVETARLTDGLADVGAIVTFTGVCRADSDRLAALELEHYPGMAEAEIRRICAEAASRWPVLALCAIHRVGLIRPGENIVLVAAASTHRQPAFDAAGFVMDFLKSRAPFWKKEHLADGTTGSWVDAKESDEQALTRWSLSD